MEEQIFLNQGSVLISSSRIEIAGQTFATRNVGSVRVENKGVSVLAILLAVLGLSMLAGSSPVLGLCLFIGGGAWAYQSATRRVLKLMAGGGEVVALRTNNWKFAEALRTAIANAISVR